MARDAAAVVDLRRALGERLVLCRKAAGFTQAELAELLYCHRTKVAHVEKGRAGADEQFWRRADGALGADGVLVRAAEDVRAARSRHEADRLVAERDTARRLAEASEEQKPITGVLDQWNDELYAVAGWLDERTGWPIGRARQLVSEHRRNYPRGNGHNRTRLARSAIADRLARYYGLPTGEDGPELFVPTVEGRSLPTSILTSREWMPSGRSVDAPGERMVSWPGEEPFMRFDDFQANGAVRRIADAQSNRIRLADLPIYRLLDLATDPQGLRSTFGVAQFVDYALTIDLLEAELADVISTPQPPNTRLMLRESYLPDLASVMELSGRMCAGGVLSLCAIARAADPDRGPADYMILLQERSGAVVNASGSLAVIPKAFHAPLVDYRADVRIGATLRRELEQELFGRIDVDGTEGPQRAADPMHRDRLSAPMRWLLDDPQRLRMERTGFGLNLVSGNYEFACLVVIEDEEFWSRFGGVVEANWEVSRLRQFSTLDGDLLTRLAGDEQWNNEGLFAFVLGLQRLQQINPARVAKIQIQETNPSSRWTASGQ